MTKTLEDYFADWEGHNFGFGYGSGEEHTIWALKTFLKACPEDGGYDYKTLEARLGAVIAWLLINALCKADIFEYGTSPRYAWFTEKGKRLKAFIGSQTLDDLVEMTNRDQNYFYCDPHDCNCGPSGYEAGRVCQNPFWIDKPV